MLKIVSITGNSGNVNLEFMDRTLPPPAEFAVNAGQTRSQGAFMCPMGPGNEVTVESADWGESQGWGSGVKQWGASSFK